MEDLRSMTRDAIQKLDETLKEIHDPAGDATEAFCQVLYCLSDRLSRIEDKLGILPDD